MRTPPIIYRANGTQETVAPKNKKNFSLQELQSFVGGYIEMVFLFAISDSLVMVVNEEGKLDELPINVRATEIIRQAGIQNTIAGDALVCSSKLIK